MEQEALFSTSLLLTPTVVISQDAMLSAILSKISWGSRRSGTRVRYVA